MVTPKYVKLDESQRYAFIQGSRGGVITYVRLDDVYVALTNAGVAHHKLVADEIDAKVELLTELKKNGW